MHIKGVLNIYYNRRFLYILCTVLISAPRLPLSNLSLNILIPSSVKLTIDFPFPLNILHFANVNLPGFLLLDLCMCCAVCSRWDLVVVVLAAYLMLQNDNQMIIVLRRLSVSSGVRLFTSRNYVSIHKGLQSFLKIVSVVNTKLCTRNCFIF